MRIRIVGDEVPNFVAEHPSDLLSQLEDQPGARWIWGSAHGLHSRSELRANREICLLLRIPESDDDTATSCPVHADECVAKARQLAHGRYAHLANNRQHIVHLTRVALGYL